MRFLSVLLTILICSACSHYGYQVGKKFRIEGRTNSPETVSLALAEAEAIRAEAQYTRSCAKNPERCYGGFGYGFGYLDMPEGYTLAGLQAVQSQTQSLRTKTKKRVNLEAMDKKLDKIQRETKKTKEGLKTFMKTRAGR